MEVYMALINVTPITNNMNLKILTNKLEFDAPQLSPIETNVFGSYLISYVVNSFAYGFVPQLIASTCSRDDILFRVSTKEEIETVIKSNNPMIFEIDPHSYISITKLGKEVGFDPNYVKIHHMYNFTSFLFPDTSLLYHLGTGLSIYYSISFKETKAIMKFSNIILAGKLPIYLISSDFILSYYPKALNNLFFIEKELLLNWNNFSRLFQQSD